MVDWAGVGGSQGIPSGLGGQLAGTRAAPTDRVANTVTGGGQKNAFAQAVNNILAAVVNDEVDVNTAIDQAFAQLTGKTKGQGYYGPNVTQMGMQNPNLAIAGSASGLVNQTPGYADAQGYSPGSANVLEAAPVNFSSADQPADDFANLDPSSFITESGDSGEEFDKGGYLAALQNEINQINQVEYDDATLAEAAAHNQSIMNAAERKAIESELDDNLERFNFTPATRVVSAGAVGGGPRITGGLMGRKAPGEFSVPTDDNPGGIDGGGGEIRRRNRTPNYAAYVDMYDDLLAAQPSNMSKADWGRRHWERHGGQEGRRFGPAGMPMVSGPMPEPGDYFSSGPNVAIADPRPANPVEYGNAFQGVSRPARTRRLSPQEAGGWR